MGGELPSPAPSNFAGEPTSQDVDEFDVVKEFVPIRFLENRIRTLSRTSAPHDLSRLEQHRENMVTFHAEENWTKLNSEQLNASRTVQVHNFIVQYATCHDKKYVRLKLNTQYFGSESTLVLQLIVMVHVPASYNNPALRMSSFLLAKLLF